MPIIAALFGALIAGLVYWIKYGNGMEHINNAVRDWRSARRRTASERQIGSAPLRSLRHPADAAGVLLELVARLRGVPTPEQEAAILVQMRGIVEPGDDLDKRMVVIRHAATLAPDAKAAIDALAPILRDSLDSSERSHFARMLQAVAEIHQGPTEAQERLIAQILRAIDEDR
ncbi:hypothetical protein [Methylobacterium sp. 77]|uniref:hypothetical protein n=1 Tax=Methylobacterium sp. 77 TaxID=1101192 RepID=UPI00036FD5B9|nr:hypothetical protein [Methylobacterium sp. 77]